MCEHCQNIIEKVWSKLEEGRQFRTPDLYKGKNFFIKEKYNQKITITPQNISITKESFSSTLHYLFQNDHYFKNQCEIRSSNSEKAAGPLCLVSRDKNSNVRCINYILPILQNYQIVDIYQKRPNKTWLV
ncbi:MAG: hypothetical protein V1874_03610 [Spirochaetota bacterium]